MYFVQQLGPEVEAFNQRAKAIIQTLCDQVKPVAVKSKIPSRQDVFAAPERQGKLFKLRDGNLSYTRADKVLFYFDPGDLVGVEQAILGGTGAKVLSDFAVIVDIYDSNQFLDSAHGNPDLNRLWSEYLTITQGMLSALAGNLFKEEITAPPEIKAFQPNQVIAEQGSKASEVMLLVEGSAEASVDGLPSGAILPGELFGMVSTLTGVPHTATIVATEPCMIMSLPKENFVLLVERRPSAYLKQIEDMAHLLVDLGDKPISVKISNF